MLWLMNSLQDMLGAISPFDKYFQIILYAFKKAQPAEMPYRW